MPAVERSLTVVAPGLEAASAFAPAREGPPLEALGTLRARADRHPGVSGALEAVLFALFDYGADDTDLPVAAVTQAVDLDGPPGGWWLRADPVLLRADRDTLMFMGAVTDLSAAEAGRLAIDLEAVFLPHGWHIQVGHPTRWYLRLAEDPRIRTHPPAAVLGRDVRGLLPYGDRGAQWRVLLNEVQMQLHISAINEQRRARGAAEVNSLWFWGGGQVPRLHNTWAALWCDDVLGRGLACAAGAVCRPRPPRAEPWLAQAEAGAHVLVIDELDAPARAGDAAAWWTRVRALDEQWLAPLLTALRRRELAAVTLTAGTGTDLRLTPRGIRRWWRRRTTV